MATVIVKSRDSLLTTSSGYTNYRGILNLVIILLVLSNGRVALENVIKYGILVDPLSWLLFFVEGSKHWPALLIVATLGIHILISLLAEKLIALQLPEKSIEKRNGVTPSGDGDSVGKKRTNAFDPPNKVKFYYSAQQALANAIIITNLFACLSLPPVVIYSFDTHPISTSGSLMLVSIVFLKLVSYHMINYWCREIKLCQEDERLYSRTTKSFLNSYTPPVVEFGDMKKLSSSTPPSPTTKTNGNSNSTSTIIARESSKETNREVALRTLAKYPGNLTLRDICNYMLFPTLCYEIQFARTERLRKRFLIKRAIELLILSQLDLALIQQWIVPTVSNSVLPFRQMQFSHMLERLLKLAIPNHVIWLIWFYLFFHSLLNIVAELTRFADREFYRDWWNSESVYYFWSNWNIPVHKWCARHLYVPLISLGLNKCQASTTVFFVSAFFHEYLVSVPLKMFRMWAFTGMLIQLPWARFVSAYFNNHFANVAVWVSLIIGQPLCILMYYHDYYVINNTKAATAAIQ